MTTLPVESPDEAVRRAQRDAECRWAWRACIVSPLLGGLTWAFVAKYLLFVMYLKPVTTTFSVMEALRWKPALALGVLAFVAPWCWLVTVRTPRSTTRLPWAALLSFIVVIGACLVLDRPRAKWFFVEWAIVRTPNPSFARNTLMWEQRKFERIGSHPESAPLVRLVGSSQIYQGADLDLLHAEVPAVTWEKNCLAGFGPMQYPWVLDVLFDPQPQMVVCWLSEFDFFREDQLPLNRLRWASTLNGVDRLSRSIDWPLVNVDRRWQPLSEGRNWQTDPQDQSSLRSDYADLELAAALPLWRLRDHVRRTVFHYWQDVSRPSAAANVDGPQLAQSADMEYAQESLRNNVGRKQFVDTNFRAFEQFARALQDANVRLLVCEGSTHPDATAVYDPQFRSETRNRLQELAKTVGFQYLDESQLPAFTREDFADPYHLNQHGCSRFSAFLADVVRRELADSPQPSVPQP